MVTLDPRLLDKLGLKHQYDVLYREGTETGSLMCLAFIPTVLIPAMSLGHSEIMSLAVPT